MVGFCKHGNEHPICMKWGIYSQAEVLLASQGLCFLDEVMFMISVLLWFYLTFSMDNSY